MPFADIALCFDASADIANAESLLAEAKVLNELARLDVVPIMAPQKHTAKNRPGLPSHISEPLDALAIDPIIAPYTVNAKTIIWHDPACLKSVPLRTRYVCKNMVVVTDRDFSLRNGVDLFDAPEHMTALEDAVFGGTLHLVPVSENNRKSIDPWHRDAGENWNLASSHWPIVIEREMMEPVRAPSDRRGTWFGQGRQHYPAPAILNQLFSEKAEFCGLVGGTSYFGSEPPAHWSIYDPAGITQTRFLRDIDFYLAFANPLWSGNEPQMIATAIAAGKVVIADADRAAPFGDGVICADQDTVDEIINRLVTDPKAYQEQVRHGQNCLSEFSDTAFKAKVTTILREMDAL